jgi:hypothetical protein
MSRFVLLSLFSLSLGALQGPALSAAPAFEKWRALSDRPDSVFGADANGRVPVWWDVTQDGEPDLLLCADGEISRVFIDETGTLAVTDVLFPLGSGAGRAFAALDVDGDGVEELLGMGFDVSLFRVVAPDQLARVAVPMPMMPSRSVSDMAVGDLNRDGLPDVYVGVGRGGPERLNFSSQPNFILMNRGQGRFEHVAVAPRGGLTLGVVLADIDADGRLDLIESVDTSTIAGPSRLLWNRTEPGALVPTFEPAEGRWDVGTHGMGLAVGDLDQDGLLDMYNTSRGQDILVMGNASGGFDDQTVARGILHEWASLGLRVQWSPSIVDLDCDGRLDLLVRHGLPSTFSTMIVSAWAADLLYLQGADGMFERAPVPSEDGDGEGKHFAVGDIEGDGRPDVGLDGLSSDVHVWHNVSNVPETTARLTVRFKPTVSAMPPTGAVVIGTCGGLTHTRHLTSGGKIGGRESPELHFAWPDCADEAPALTVAWPSGASSTHVVDVGLTLTHVEEPRWVSEGVGGVLTLDPDRTGALEACALNDAQDWVCCESTCQVSAPSGGVRWVGLDERPRLGLPSLEVSWLLTTEPALLVPGGSFQLTVSQVGGLSAIPGAEVNVTVDGVLVPWTSEDMAHRTLSAEAVAPSSGAMSATLTVGGESVAQWQRPTGYVVDPSSPFLELYPVRAVGTVEEFGSFEVHVHSYPGELDLYDGGEWSFTTAGGTPVPISSSIREADMRRTSLFVDWEVLEGIDSLLMRDHPDGEPVVLPVYQPTNASDLADLVARAECGLLRTRVAPSRDTVAGVLTLYDADERPLLVPSSVVVLEVEGGQLMVAPHVSVGLKDMTFSIKVGDVEGDGRITVRSPTGESWGTCTFEVAARPPQPVDVDASWATLSKIELDRATYDKARLRIGVLNLHGELLGTDVWPTVTLEGGDWYAGLAPTGAGGLVGDVAPRDGEDSIRLTVTLQGQLIESFEIAVSGEFPATDGAGTTPGSPGEPDGGCEGADSDSKRSLYALLMLVFAWTRRMRGLSADVTTGRALGATG